MTGTDGRFSLGPTAEIGAGDLANLRPRTVGWPRRLTRSIVPGIVAFLVLFGGWELGVRVTHIPATELVAPSSIFRELWRAPGFFASNAWITIQEAFWGFLVAFAVAIAAAVLVVHSKVMDRALTPIVVMLQVTPILALAPPLVVWLGFGPQPKIVMAALITFVPLFTNATVGFRAIDPATFEVMRSVNASKPEIFTRLRVPHSLPYLLAATRVCVGLAPHRRCRGRVLRLLGRARLDHGQCPAIPGGQRRVGSDLHPHLHRRRARRAGDRRAPPAPALGRGRPGQPLVGLCAAMLPATVGSDEKERSLVPRSAGHQPAAFAKAVLGCLALFVATAASARAATAPTRPGSSAPVSAATGVTSAGISPAECAANRRAGTIIFVTSYSYAPAASIADVVVAARRGFFKDMCLDVTLQPGFSTDNVALVSADRVQISSLGSDSEVLAARAEGAKLEGVLTYGHTAVSELITPGDARITNLKQLDGTTVGIKGALPYEISAMLARAGVNIASLRQVQVGYDPVIIDQGRIMALPVYKSNEIRELNVLGYKYKVWDPTTLRRRRFVRVPRRQHGVRQPRTRRRSPTSCAPTSPGSGGATSTRTRPSPTASSSSRRSSASRARSGASAGGSSPASSSGTHPRPSRSARSTSPSSGTSTRRTCVCTSSPRA